MLASVGVGGVEAQQGAPGSIATWVVEGPALPQQRRSARDEEDDDDTFILIREPAAGAWRRWLAWGRRGLRKAFFVGRRRGKGEEEEEVVEEWGLYRRGDMKEQLGRVGLKVRRPRGRAVTDLERAAAEVFGPEVSGLERRLVGAVDRGDRIGLFS